MNEDSNRWRYRANKEWGIDLIRPLTPSPLCDALNPPLITRWKQYTGFCCWWREREYIYKIMKMTQVESYQHKTGAVLLLSTTQFNSRYIFRYFWFCTIISGSFNVSLLFSFSYFYNIRERENCLIDIEWRILVC